MTYNQWILTPEGQLAATIVFQSLWIKQPFDVFALHQGIRKRYHEAKEIDQTDREIDKYFAEREKKSKTSKKVIYRGSDK